MELKPREPSTVQKSVRVPVHILKALEDEAANAKPLPISVPFAIVQILEHWYEHLPKD